MQVTEHLGRIAAAKNFPVGFLFLLNVRFDARVEFDFIDELFILRCLILRKAHIDVHQLRAVFKHVDKSGFPLCGPVLLVVLRFLKAETFERGVLC